MNELLPYHDQLLGYLRKHHGKDAEDISQNLWLKLARHCPYDPARGEPMAFLITCAKNAAASFYESENRHGHAELFDDATRYDCEIRELLECLPAKVREIAERRLQGYTLREMPVSKSEAGRLLQQAQKLVIANLR